jgi:hypothetical protein
MYNFKFLFTILFFLFSVPILVAENESESDSQADRRMNSQKRIYVNTYHAGQMKNFLGFGFSYSIHKKLNLDFSYQYKNSSFDGLSLGISQRGTRLSIAEVIREREIELFTFSAKLFPWETIPFFFNIGVYKNINPYEYTKTEIGSFNLSNNQFTPREIVQYGFVVSPYVGAKLGLGIEYLFKAGIFLNLELNLFDLKKREVNTFYYDTSSRTSLEQKIINYEYYKTSYGNFGRYIEFPRLTLSIGYAF